MISDLRTRLDDGRHNMPAVVISVDDNPRSAVVEIANGYLRTTIQGGVRAREFILSLTAPETNTVGKLLKVISAQRGYSVAPAEDLSENHPSSDLEVDGFGDLRTGATLVHRRWSDLELAGFIASATRRHNISYSPATVPAAEQSLVLALAHAEALRALAASAAKRSGLSVSVSDLLSVASALETQYEADRSRQATAIPAPIVRDDDFGEGEIRVGTVYRRDLRTGLVSPHAANRPPEPVVLLEPRQEDIADTSVLIRWKRPRDLDTCSIEVWRDVVPDVRRNDNPDLTTSVRLVRRGRAMNPDHGRWMVEMSAATFKEYLDDGSGEAMAPDPDTEYFYRVYIIDVMREKAESDSLRVRTLPQRAVITSVSPSTVPHGTPTVLTISGERFHDGMIVRIGDKMFTPSVVDTSTATVTTTTWLPSYAGKFLDLTLTSFSGLVAVKKRMVKIT